MLVVTTYRVVQVGPALTQEHQVSDAAENEQTHNEDHVFSQFFPNRTLLLAQDDTTQHLPMVRSQPKGERMNNRKIQEHSQTPAQVLRQAIVEIQRRGWTQYALQDAAGQVCAMGALHYAISGSLHPKTMNADQARILDAITPTLSRVMHEQYPSAKPTFGVTYMNDHDVNNAEELIACMEKAAMMLEEEKQSSLNGPYSDQ